MVLVANAELKMGKGKIGAQCAHAAVGAVERLHSLRQTRALRQWERCGQPKVALSAASTQVRRGACVSTARSPLPPTAGQLTCATLQPHHHTHHNPCRTCGSWLRRRRRRGCPHSSCRTPVGLASGCCTRLLLLLCCLSCAASRGTHTALSPSIHAPSQQVAPRWPPAAAQCWRSGLLRRAQSTASRVT